MKPLLGSLLGLAVVALPLFSLQAAGPEKDKPADEATALAVKLTEQGAATFDTYNAKAMADYYLDDAELFLGACPRIRVRNPQVIATKELANFEPN